MKFITQDRLLDASEEVKEIICKWWKPEIGDIVMNKYNELAVLDLDKLRQLEIMKKKGNIVVPLLTEGQLIDIIRKYAQIDIYTVDREWCIQLFEVYVSANDGIDCIYETSNKELINALFSALEWLCEDK